MSVDKRNLFSSGGVNQTWFSLFHNTRGTLVAKKWTLNGYIDMYSYCIFFLNICPEICVCVFVCVME
jgi:hypothetical protein